MSLPEITARARFLLDWAERPGNERAFGRDSEDAIGKALAEPAARAQLPVATWLLGTWRLGRGFARVLRGDARGFDEARTGQALRRCSLLLRERKRAPGPRGRSESAFAPLHGALCCVHGLALGDPHAEELYAAHRALPDGAFPGESDAFALFIRELLVLRSGERPAVTMRLGPWRPVLQHWEQGPQLAHALARALDVHLSAVSGAGTFAEPPSQLYPAEALAVLRVRDALGLRTPKVDHPLLFTNLGTMQPVGPWPEDDVVRRVEQALGRPPRR